VPQRPAAQVARVLLPAGQMVPHAPQWLTLVAVSTQASPQRCWPEGQPLVQTALAPVVDAHTGVPPVHALPQRPQLLVPLRAVSQPLEGLPSQSPKPGSHDSPQVPLAQVAAPLVPLGQTRPQVPQLPAELSVATSQPLLGWLSQSELPGEQVMRQTPITHAAVLLGPEAHALPQAPQLPALLLRFTSQPLAGSPSQLAKPALQVSWQAPMTQLAAALAPTGQALPQRPQSVASLWRFAQEFPQRVCPDWQPDTHCDIPPVVAHRGVDPEHARPQAPQLAEPSSETSQPLVESPSQSA
jgi:hypothetical protein